MTSDVDVILIDDTDDEKSIVEGESEEGEDKSEEEIYIVEAIRKWRYNKKTKEREFFVKWTGYSEDENTWEPERHLDCPRILKKFKKTLTIRELNYLNSKDPDKLNGFQRNADFLKCLGADGAHDSDNEESDKVEKQKFYVLVQFEDSNTHEEVSWNDYYRERPDEAWDFFESRLFCDTNHSS